MAQSSLKLGSVGIWTSQFEHHPAVKVQEAVSELDELGYGAIWFGEAVGREALTHAGLLLAATRRIVVGTFQQLLDGVQEGVGVSGERRRERGQQAVRDAKSLGRGDAQGSHQGTHERVAMRTYVFRGGLRRAVSSDGRGQPRSHATTAGLAHQEQRR